MFFKNFIVKLLLLLSIFSSNLWGAVAGDIISNIADANFTYTTGGIVRGVKSNEVNITIAQTPATIEFMAIDSSSDYKEIIQPTTYKNGNGVHSMPPATLHDGTVVSIPSKQPLRAVSQYNKNDLVIVKVRDIDQNINLNQIDSIDINVTNPSTGEVETLHLLETNASSGEFVGYFHTKAYNANNPNLVQDGYILVSDGETIEANYQDNSGVVVKTKVTKAVISKNKFALITTKEQSKDSASLGDFILYTLNIKNVSGVSYTNVKIEDLLPSGIKYKKNTFKVNGEIKTAMLSIDGKVISYIHPLLAPNSTVKVTYVAMVGAGIVDKKATNMAWASAIGAGKSNIAKITLKIKEELWCSKGFILGRIYDKDCNKTYAGECGVEGVKLFMEDGRFVVTDKEGKYHFEDVNRGEHIVQVDRLSIKGRYKLQICQDNIKFAKNPRSQFVNVGLSGINRADFCLKKIAQKVSSSLLDIKIKKLSKDSINLHIQVASDANISDTEVYLSMQDGFEYIKNSSTSEDEPIRYRDILVVKIGDKKEVSLNLKISKKDILQKELRAVLYYDTPLEKDRSSDIALVALNIKSDKLEINKIVQDNDFIKNLNAGGKSGKDDGDYSWSKAYKHQSMPEFKREDVDKLGGKAKFVWPPKGWVPHIPSTKIAILYPKGGSVTLLHNGKKVDMVHYEGLYRGSNGMQIMHYKGIDLSEGLNHFEAIIKKGGRVIDRLSRDIYVESHAPAIVKFLPKYSYLLADGKHEPIIALELRGSSGHLLRGGLRGSFSTDSKHQPAKVSNGKGVFVVDEKGIAYLHLKPTTKSGIANIRLKLANGETETITVRLKPYLREWIIVGFAQGSIGYSTLSRHSKRVANKQKSGLITSGRVSLFAKGKIKGKWLLTIAYDSGRKRGDRELFDSIDPDKYYTIYQDATKQGNEAPSTRKLYIKLERDNFYAMFGDFATNIEGGEFNSYKRNFTGFKSEYRGKNIDILGFVAKTDKYNIREELKPDGTSGYYYLKNKNIIEGSESISLEVRYRTRPEKMLEHITLTRWKDYTIDYDEGKIYFKEPIFSKDHELNPRTIVVTYEVDGYNGSNYTYGGRASWHSTDEKTSLGISAIKEDKGTVKNSLIGVDGNFKINKNLEVNAEFAISKSKKEHKTVSGKASKIELEYSDKNSSISAYYRKEDSTFGLGNEAEILKATRKIGIDFSRVLSAKWRLDASIYQNRDYKENGIHTDENVINPTIKYSDSNNSFEFGYRYAKNSNSKATNQITLKASRYFFDKKLKASIEHEQALCSNEDSTFPTRTALKIDYNKDKNSTYFATIERVDSNGKVSWHSIAGFDYKPWENTKISSTRLMDIDANGEVNIYNTIGLSHHFKVGKKWQFNIGYEKGIKEENSTQSNYDTISLGAKYQDENLSSDASLELRRGDDENRINLNIGVYLKHDKELGYAFGLKYNKLWKKDAKSRDIDAKFALAYRSEDLKWIILERLDYIDKISRDKKSYNKESKLVNNMHLFYHPNFTWEFGLHLGLKYTKDTLDNESYSGWSSLIGLDGIYNINRDWAVGLNGAVKNSFSANSSEYCAGIYASTSLWEDTVLTLGYNYKGFNDSDFSALNWHNQGIYLQFKIKFDQEDIKSVLKKVAK